MIKKTIIAIILGTLNSCATIWTKSYYDIQLTSDKLPAQVQVNDTLYDLPAKIKIKRSKYDLPLELMTDSINKNFILKSSLNPTFIFANLLWTEFCPIAYWVDLTNPKRYFYGKSAFLNLNDTTTILEPMIFKKIHVYFEKQYPTSKNQFYLTVSLPWINNFYLQPSQKPIKLNTGLWGFSTGLDYYYSQSQFFNISVAAVSDFFISVPAAIDIYGEYELMNSFYASFTHNHHLGRFYIGYGINYSINSWNYKYPSVPYIPPRSQEPITKSNLCFGFVTNGYYQFGKHFQLGIIYRPSLIQIDPDFEFKYEHLISIDFGWKFKL